MSLFHAPKRASSERCHSPRVSPSREESTRTKVGRRSWLKHAMLLAGAGWTIQTESTGAEWSPRNLARFNALRIRNVTRRTVKLEYRPTPRRAMDRELPHWRYTEICTVELSDGTRGYGETLLYYTWGATSDEDVAAVHMKNAATVMWDDQLGAGLQMALMDAVAKAVGVPIHRLLGTAWTKTTPLSWWNIDMPPQDMAAECRLAHRSGYTSYKTKGRPWFDLWEQVKQSAAGVPDDFKIDMDFNDTLLDAKRAIPILKTLEAYPQIDIYESPIPQSDVEGNREICEATRVNVAMHYGTPDPAIAVRERVCDGFVIGGGASRVMSQGRFAGQVEMPFWLQLVGSGITAAYSLHFGAVLKQATWPAVNCHQLYEHDLLASPIEVKQGLAQVPEKPGLGMEIDWDEVEKRTVVKPQSRPEPQRLMQVQWMDGRVMDVANNGQVNFMLRLGMDAKMPYFEPGVQTISIPDDGSTQWKDRHAAAQNPRVTSKAE